MVQIQGMTMLPPPQGECAGEVLSSSCDWLCMPEIARQKAEQEVRCEGNEGAKQA